MFVAFLIAVIVGITFHEFSHAAVATLQGDHTARSQGRLTLNPIVHLDPLGSIALILAGIGWGRPVPVTPSNLRNRRFGGILVGLAGPASNFVLALAAVVALRLAYPTADTTFDVPFSLRLLYMPGRRERHPRRVQPPADPAAGRVQPALARAATVAPGHPHASWTSTGSSCSSAS